MSDSEDGSLSSLMAAKREPETANPPPIPPRDTSDNEDNVRLVDLQRKGVQEAVFASQESDDDDDNMSLAELTKKRKRSNGTSSPAVKKEKVSNSPSDSDSEDDIPIAQLTKKSKKVSAVKKEKSSSSTSKKKSAKLAAGKGKKTATAAKGKKTLKKEKKEKRSKIEIEMENVHKWWLEEDDLEGDEKWKTLKHNGVLFAPLYEPHGIPILYDGKVVTLTPEQEEYATYFARYLETDHYTKDVFRKNFWTCWKKLIKSCGPTKASVITEFSKVDFKPIWRHLEAQKEQNKNKSKEQKDVEKAARAELTEQYGYAYLDGRKEKVGNYRVEPPGLFLGRGAHPKAGMFKLRITPKDITINIGKNQKPPKPSAPYENEAWGNVVCNNRVTWLAYWKENVNDSIKYVMLHSSSKLKGIADMKKFDVARNLKNNVGRIRLDYMAKLKSKKEVERQFATAMWVIDKLALRVGNEKGEDEADTVGCCSLRKEHISLVPPSRLVFDFLGKDSMRYFNEVEVDPQVYKNIAQFVKDKEPTHEVFDKINSAKLNTHLKNYMEGLSAKVFRTFNASHTLELELENVTFKKDATVEEKILDFNRANRQVAILCNHQRSQPKTHTVQMDKMKDKISDIQKEMKEAQAHKKLLLSGETPKSPKASSSKKRKRDEADDEGPEKKKKRLPATPEKCDNLLNRLKERKKKLEIRMTEKDELKTIALSTSKINYIDPRLTVAWCKRNDVPLEKIFSKTLREKFTWAMDVPGDWKF